MSDTNWFGTAKTVEALIKTLDTFVDDSTSKEVGNVIKLHAKIAVVAAWIPYIGFLAYAVNTWWMYVRISNALNVPFSENKGKALATGLGMNIVTFVLLLIVSEVVDLIPVFGWVADAVIFSFVFYSASLAAGIGYGWALAKIMQQNPKTPAVNLDSLQKVQDAFQQVVDKTSEAPDQKKLT